MTTCNPIIHGNRNTYKIKQWTMHDSYTSCNYQKPTKNVPMYAYNRKEKTIKNEKGNLTKLKKTAKKPYKNEKTKTKKQTNKSTGK